MRTPGAGLRGAHRRAHPVNPRLVRRRGHDAAWPDPTDDDRLAAQGRLVALLHRREEGVEVQVHDRPPKREVPPSVDRMASLWPASTSLVVTTICPQRRHDHLPRVPPVADRGAMTDDTPVYTAHDIPDLINSLPTLFGFTPEDSIIAIATSGPRNRMGFRLRMDMPAMADVERAAAQIVAHLADQGAEGAMVIAVTPQTDVAARLVPAIERRLGTIRPVGMRAGGGVYDDRILAFFRPFPEFAKSFVQGGFVGSRISFGCKRHAATVTRYTGRNLERDVCAGGEVYESFCE